MGLYGRISSSGFRYDEYIAATSKTNNRTTFARNRTELSSSVAAHRNACPCKGFMLSCAGRRIDEKSAAAALLRYIGLYTDTTPLMRCGNYVVCMSYASRLTYTAATIRRCLYTFSLPNIFSPSLSSSRCYYTR
jgi:hypothetical protein